MEIPNMTNCLACGASECRKILDFGPQPAANLLSEEANARVKRVPLSLRYCSACGHAQQDTFYPPQELFENYLYQSGTTQTLSNFFDWLASSVKHTTSQSSRILEIASNDGSFLMALRRTGLTATGVEPAGNLAALSKERGLDVIHGFWPEACPPGKFERIVAMNVLAHGPNPKMFLTEVARALTSDGLAYIQVSQADMFRNFEFDTLYHEHYSFFCPSSLKALSTRAGFKKSAFCKTKIHGGSIMAVFGFENSPVEEAALRLIEGPFALGRLKELDRPTEVDANILGERANGTCATITALHRLSRESGRKFVLVGAAAKAVTMVQASGVVFDYVTDEAPLKISKFIPGTAMKIIPFSEMAAIKQSCVFVIGAWNFRDEIERKLRKIRPGSGDLVVVYFPTVAIDELAR